MTSVGRNKFNNILYTHISEATLPTPLPPPWRWTNESGRWMEQSKTHKLNTTHLVEKQPAWVMNEKKKSQTGWRLGVVTQGGGVEERPFFLYYDVNCIQTSTYSAVSLTVKVPPDRRPGETHCPLFQSAQKPQNLMSHAQNGPKYLCSPTGNCA